MLAPSPTATTPFLTSILASRPVNSFWVADGIATSHGTFQMLPFFDVVGSGPFHTNVF